MEEGRKGKEGRSPNISILPEAEGERKNETLLTSMPTHLKEGMHAINHTWEIKN